MKSKGFTLIELLGVIVLLALIMLMVFPTIITTIKKSTNSKNKIYEKLIISAAEDYVSENKSYFNESDESKYCIVVNDLIDYGLFDEDELVDSKEILENKSVQVLYSDNKFSYSLINTSDCKSIKNVNRYKNGKVVYFDVKEGNICNNYKEANSATGYNGINPSDGQNSCLKFYAFNDDGGDTVSLILDHNTTASVAWNSSGSNSKGPNELLSQLKSDTSSWRGTNTPSNYSIDQSSSTSKAQYTIDYTGYKARLITANEVAKITNNTTFNEATTSNNYFFFDTNTQNQSDTCKSGNTTGCQYGWLNDRTMKDCKDYGCLNNSDVDMYGYWTISSTASLTNYAWYIYFLGYIQGATITNKSNYGVRPVIEVERKIINKKSGSKVVKKCNVISGTGTNMGDIVECNDDNFYVIENASGRVKLLAVNNISTTNSIGSAINIAAGYGNTLRNNKYNIISSRLLYLYEVYNALSAVTVQINSHESELKPITTSNGWNKIDLTWLYQDFSKNIISYWMLYSEDDNGYSYDNICVNGTKAAIINDCNGTLGVRPVITIPSSILKR